MNSKVASSMVKLFTTKNILAMQFPKIGQAAQSDAYATNGSDQRAALLKQCKKPSSEKITQICSEQFEKKIQVRTVLQDYGDRLVDYRKENPYNPVSSPFARQQFNTKLKSASTEEKMNEKFLKIAENFAENEKTYPLPKSSMFSNMFVGGVIGSVSGGAAVSIPHLFHFIGKGISNRRYMVRVGAGMLVGALAPVVYCAAIDFKNKIRAWRHYQNEPGIREDVEMKYKFVKAGIDNETAARIEFENKYGHFIK